jgi:hypothetical protein
MDIGNEVLSFARSPLRASAENILGLRIPFGDAAVLVHLNEGVECGVDDAACELLLSDSASCAI